MLLNFAEVLATMGQNAAFNIANESPAQGTYLLNTLLPERTMYSYDVKAGNMTIRSVMAGLVGMDSSYPPGLVVESNAWAAQTAKFAIENYMPEETLRYMQNTLMQLNLTQQPTVQYIEDEALDFLNKVIIQPQRDVMEWLRGQALLGGIDWTFNQKRLLVDYGIPAANKLASRTVANADWYGHATTSKFWADVLSARRLLKYNVRGFWLNSATLDIITMNQGNSARLVTQTDSIVTLRRIIVRNGVEVLSDDAREQITFNIYDGEAEVINPVAPTTTKILKFIPDGKIIGLGNNVASGYRPGQGGTPNSVPNNALGYTHIGPTIEGGGRPGRWAELYTPQDRPYQLNGRSVTNGLPVIEAPEKIVILTTEMGA